MEEPSNETGTPPFQIKCDAMRFKTFVYPSFCDHSFIVCPLWCPIIRMSSKFAFNLEYLEKKLLKISASFPPIWSHVRTFGRLCIVLVSIQRAVDNGTDQFTTSIPCGLIYYCALLMFTVKFKSERSHKHTLINLYSIILFILIVRHMTEVIPTTTTDQNEHSTSALKKNGNL